MSILTDSSCGVVLSSEGERVLIDMIAYGVKKTSSMATQTGKGRGKVHIVQCTCTVYMYSVHVYMYMCIKQTHNECTCILCTHACTICIQGLYAGTSCYIIIYNICTVYPVFQLLIHVHAHTSASIYPYMFVCRHYLLKTAGLC